MCSSRCLTAFYSDDAVAESCCHGGRGERGDDRTITTRCCSLDQGVRVTVCDSDHAVRWARWWSGAGKTRQSECGWTARIQMRHQWCLPLIRSLRHHTAIGLGESRGHTSGGRGRWKLRLLRLVTVVMVVTAAPAATVALPQLPEAHIRTQLRQAPAPVPAETRKGIPLRSDGEAGKGSSHVLSRVLRSVPRRLRG